MKFTFIVFINDKIWQRYTRRPHFSSLSKFGDLSIIEYPLSLLSKSFLKNPILEIKYYIKYSRGKRLDYLTNIKIIRPIIVFPATTDNKIFQVVNRIFVLFFIWIFSLKGRNNICFLTYYNQLWLKTRMGNSKYILDMNDEWSLFADDEKIKEKIKRLTKKTINNVNLVTCVTKKLSDEYSFNGTSYFVPNAVDVNHYVPNFDSVTIRKKENALSFDRGFLKINNNDISQYSKSVESFQNLKGPIVGSISGLSEIWTGYKFVQDVEKLLPDYFNMVSSGNVHKPINTEFIEDYESYIKNPRIKFFGHLDYSLLPNFLQNINVGLVFYKKSELNQYAAPNKIWAYLSMGLPVVSIDFLNESDKEIYEGMVTFVKNPERYVEGIIKAYQEDNQTLRVKRRQLAVKYSTENRSETIIRIINQNLF